jgi:serine/threonine protein kinase
MMVDDNARGETQAPQHLYSAFAAADVEVWNESRFTRVKKLADASRNKGTVMLMRDQSKGDLVAVKKMPNTWIKDSHEEFMKQHPKETEMPWQDIGCTAFLNTANYSNACDLRGVFRDDDNTYVVSTFASDGDLFSVAEEGDTPGPKREDAFAPLVLELLLALKTLHEMQIVHRDISLENVLRTKVQGPNGLSSTTVKIIDYGMASTGRKFQNCPRGKASYEAPEMQKEDVYDAFLSDAFAAGVLVYSMLMKDYPWLSTKPGRCKCYEYVKAKGFRAYSAHRCVRGSNKRIKEVASEDLLRLLEGMLDLDPETRLTLGEVQFQSRRSVWDEPWVQKYMKAKK